MMSCVISKRSHFFFYKIKYFLSFFLLLYIFSVIIMDTVNQEIPKKAVRALRSRLHVVKKHLEPIFAKPLSEIYTKLPIAERYELEVLLSYSLNTLYYSTYN